MGAARVLIVNADDLGLSEAVNAGIATAHERGIVTSASLMVRQGAAAAAAGYAATHPALAVGLHIDLGQWDYMEGEWTVAYQRCLPDDEAAAEAECRAQLDGFRRLLNRDPTHIDSHQHTHMSEPVATVADRLAAELGVPLRARGGIRYEGGFYGQTGKGEPFPDSIGVENLIRILSSMPPGWTELGCHPGLGMREESSYGREREVEVRALCDLRVREAIETEGIELRSFAQLG
ncbi:MAG TPA: ChbG/HpnK family deacetylase [Solirubrobacterales bacterium]|nr:ChbG/HpnK family deacetylase [Solirubrobacterales bacterium]